MQTITLAAIRGTWLLESFEIEDLEKKVAPWGANARGLLIYSDTGHMSVSINRDLNKKSSIEAENIFDSILFYSGTYQVEGNVVTHQVSNASNPARIGKQMIRYAVLDGDLITLSSPQESFGRAILKWRKVKV